MELLTVLIPSSIDLEPTSHRTDRNGLTAAIVSAAMANVNKAGLELLLGQICDLSEFKALHELFLPEAMKVARRQKWRLDEATQVKIDRLLDLVLTDSIISSKCPSCHGTQYSAINPALYCDLCGGTGLLKNFDYLKAQYLGISDRAYRKTWRERESDLKALLDRRAYQAKRRIINNLYEQLDG